MCKRAMAGRVAFAGLSARGRFPAVDSSGHVNYGAAGSWGFFIFTRLSRNGAARLSMFRAARRFLMRMIRKRQCLMLESGTMGEVRFANRLFRLVA